MEQHLLALIDDSKYDIVVRRDGDDYLVTIDGAEKRVSLADSAGGSSHALIDNKSYQVDMTQQDGAWSVYAAGKSYPVSIQNFQLAQLRNRLGVSHSVSKTKNLKAPMPGLVLQVAVSVGDEVKAGDTVVVLEAMKMENPIKSSGDGIVSKVHVLAKDSVEKGAALIEFAD